MVDIILYTALVFSMFIMFCICIYVLASFTHEKLSNRYVSTHEDTRRMVVKVRHMTCRLGLDELTPKDMIFFDHTNRLDYFIVKQSGWCRLIKTLLFGYNSKKVRIRCRRTSNYINKED